MERCLAHREGTTVADASRGVGAGEMRQKCRFVGSLISGICVSDDEVTATAGSGSPKAGGAGEVPLASARDETCEGQENGSARPDEAGTSGISTGGDVPSRVSAAGKPLAVGPGAAPSLSGGLRPRSLGPSVPGPARVSDPSDFGQLPDYLELPNYREGILSVQLEDIREIATKLDKLAQLQLHNYNGQLQMPGFQDLESYVADSVQDSIASGKAI
jgi:hypothetical protein